jgi:hypothetical protein
MERKMSNNEEAVQIAKQALRDHRDAQLSATDWAVLPDCPLDAAAQAEYTAYRQFLRDLPAQATTDEVMAFKGIPSLAAWKAATAPA